MEKNKAAYGAATTKTIDSNIISKNGLENKGNLALALAPVKVNYNTECLSIFGEEEKTMFDYAMDLLNMGFSIFPVNKMTKKPFKSWKEFQTRKPTIEEVRGWFDVKNPPNVAIVTGDISGLTVVDVDGEKGRKIIEENNFDLPPTLTAKTGRVDGGTHYYYKNIGVGNTQGKGVDIRGNGGYVVGVGSVHATGAVYEWVNFAEIAECPAWVKDWIGGKKAGAKDNDYYRDFEDGERNEAFSRFIGSLLGKGLTRAKVWEMATAWNKTHCKPPIGIDELKTIFESIISRESAKHPDMEKAERLIEECNKYSELLKCQEFWEEMGKALNFPEKYNELLILIMEKYKNPRPKEKDIKNRSMKYNKPLFKEEAEEAEYDKFFQGKRFLPVLLQRHICEKNKIVNIGGFNYLYENGVFKRDEMEKIEGEIFKTLGIEFSQSRERETSHCIYRATKTHPDEFNQRAKTHITLLNGVYEWKNDKFYSWDEWKKYTGEEYNMATIQIPVKYDEGAKCPNIEKFLKDVLPEDCFNLMIEFIGYLTIPETKYQTAFMLTGSGGNGKGTLIDMITKFIGKGNCSFVPLQEIDGNKFKRAGLFGKLLNTFADLDNKALSGSAYFKTIVAGDEIDAENKFKDPFHFRPFSRFLFSANEIPRTGDTTYAFFRRWRILHFQKQFGDIGMNFGKTDAKKENTDILETITTQEEFSGLFNLCMEGLRNLHKRGNFENPDHCKENLRTYIADSDSAKCFLYENYTETDNEENIVQKGTLYNSYCNWCLANNRKPFAEGKFGKKVLETYSKVIDGRLPGGNRERIWIKLREKTLEEKDV